MELYSNTQIIQILRRRPGRMRDFLLEVPIVELRQALEQQQRLNDLRYRGNHENVYKKNVLDFTLQQLRRQCQSQGIYVPEWIFISQHSIYGNRLIYKNPSKYYIGQKSHHFNSAREIEQSYGIFHHFDMNENEERQGEENNQPEQDRYQGDSAGMNQQEAKNSEDSFVVDDQQNVDEVEDQIDQLDEEIQEFQKKERKQSKRKKINKKSPQKNIKIKSSKGKKNQKKAGLQKSEEQKIQLPLDEDDQDIELQKYIAQSFARTQEPEKKQQKNEQVQNPEQYERLPVIVAQQKSTRKIFKMDIDSD